MNNQWKSLFQKFIIKHFSLISLKWLDGIQCKVSLLIVIVLLLRKIDLIIGSYILLLMHEHRLIKWIILCKSWWSLHLCINKSAFLVIVSILYFDYILLIILMHLIAEHILFMVLLLFLMPNRMLHFYYYVLFWYKFQTNDIIYFQYLSMGHIFAKNISINLS